MKTPCKKRKFIHAMKRPLAMVLVVIMIFGCWPEAALPVVFAANEDYPEEVGLFADTVGGQPLLAEIEHPDFSGMAIEETFDLAAKPVEIERNGTFKVWQSTTANTTNTITVKSGVDAVVFLDGITASNTAANPITVESGANATLVIVSGSTNQITTTNHFTGIHVPVGAAVTVAAENGEQEETWGTLIIIANGSGAAIGGAGGATGSSGADGGAGGDSGDIRVLSGILQLTGNIGGGTGGTGGVGAAGAAATTSAAGKAGETGGAGGAGGNSVGEIVIDGGQISVTGNIGGGDGGDGGKGGNGGNGLSDGTARGGGIGGKGGIGGVGGSNQGGITVRDGWMTIKMRPKLTGSGVQYGGQIGGGSGGEGGAGGDGGTGYKGSDTTGTAGGAGNTGGLGGDGNNGGLSSQITIYGGEVFVDVNIGGGHGGAGGIGGTGGTGGKGGYKNTTTYGGGGRGGTGGNAGKSGNGGSFSSVIIFGGTVESCYIVGGSGATGRKGGTGGTGGQSSVGSTKAAGGNGGTGGAPGNGAAGGEVHIFDGNVTITDRIDGGPAGNTGKGGSSGIGGAAGADSKVTATTGAGTTLLIEGGVVSIRSYMSKERNGSNTFTSGNIFASSSETLITRPTNGSLYGGVPLYRLYVQLVDYNDLRVSDTWFTVELENNGKPYTYTAYAEDGYAYIWLPKGNHEVRGENKTRGGGSEPVTVAEDDKSLTIYLTQMDLNLSRTPGKSYTTVDLDVEAVNADDGEKTDIKGAWWFRTDIADDRAVTEDNFMRIYDEEIDDGDKGDSNLNFTAFKVVSQTANYAKYNLEVKDNGRYWVRVHYVDGDGTSTYTVKSLDIDNIYTPYPVGVRGQVVTTGAYLYGGADDYYESIEGTYGIPFDLDGVTVIAEPEYAFDKVELTIKRNYEEHWVAKMKNGASLPQTLTLNGAFLTNTLCDDNDPRKYTILYDNTGLDGKWRSLIVKFVDREGNPANVDGDTEMSVMIPLEEDGYCRRFLALGGRLILPSSGRLSPFGYLLATEFDKDYVTRFSDFSQFDPTIPPGMAHIYIVFEEGRNAVEELYMTSDELVRFDRGDDSLELDTPYSKGFRRIPGYVEVGYKVTGLTEEDGKDYLEYWFDAEAEGLAADASQHGKIQVYVGAHRIIAGQPIEVRFYYELEESGTGIPKKDSVRVGGQWIGTKADGSSQSLDSEIKVVRQGGTATLYNDKKQGDPDHTLAVQGNDTAMWIFDDPGNEVQRRTPDEDTNVSFLYAYATDGKIPDKYQYVEEIHQVEGGQVLFTVQKQMLIGSEYDVTPEEIQVNSDGEPAYVLYGVQIDGGAVQGGVKRGYIEKTTQMVHTVTYLYRAPAYLQVEWQGVTYLGTIFPFEKETIIGYSGEDLTRKAKTMITREYDGWTYKEVLLDGNQLELSEEVPDEGLLVITEAGAQQLTINYEEAGKVTLVTVAGIRYVAVTADTEEEEDALADEPEWETKLEYSYPFDLRKLEDSYHIVPNTLTGLILSKAMVNGADRQLTEDEEGEPAYLDINPKDVSQGGDAVNDEILVEFVYELNVTNVTINLREYVKQPEEEDDEEDGDLVGGDGPDRDEGEETGSEGGEESLHGRLISSVIIPDVEKGTFFSYQAPTWPDFQIIDERIINDDEALEADKRPLTLERYISEVSDTDNTITFWYEKAAGGIVFVCYDDDPELSDPQNGKYHEIARPFFKVEYADDFRFYEEMPSFPFYQLQADADTEIELDWDDVQTLMPDPESEETSILFYIPYARDREEVTLRAINIIDSSLIQKKLRDGDEGAGAPGTEDGTDDDGAYWLQDAIIDLGRQRVGENFDYSTYLATLDTMVPARFNPVANGKALHYVHYEDDENWDGEPNDIQVLYLSDPVDAITIQYVDSVTRKVLDSVTVPVSTGTVIDMSGDEYEPDWPGFRLLRDQSTLWAKAGADEGSTITFVMEDFRWVVTVAIHKKDAEDPAIPESTYEYDRIVPAANLLSEVFPSFVSGYVCSHYVVGQGVETAMESRDRVSFPISGNLTIHLYYTETETAVDNTYADLVVVGKGYGRPGGIDGEELYSYTLREKKGSTVILTDDDAFVQLPSWTLNPGQEEKTVTIGANEARKTVDFLYQYNLETITVCTYEYDAAKPGGKGEAILTDIEIGGVRKDEGTFAYDAPVIPGWQLVDPANNGAYLGSQKKTIDFTTLPYPNYLEFYYIQATGNITIYHKDSDNGETIAVTYADVASGTTSQGFNPLSDAEMVGLNLGYYHASTDAANRNKTVTWDPDSDDPKLAPPFTLEFQYDREKQPVILEAWDSVTEKAITDGVNPITVTIPDRRVEERLDYKADWRADPDLDPEELQLSWLQDLTKRVQDVNGGYRQAAQGSTLVYVTRGAENKVKVWFNPPASGVIPVEVYEVIGWADEEAQTGPRLADSPLRTYGLPAAPGETVTISKANGQVPVIPGYDFLEEQSTLTATEGKPKAGGKPGEVESVLILMVDVRPEVKVHIYKRDQGEAPVDHLADKAEPNQPYIVTVPYVTDYALVSYKVTLTGADGSPETTEYFGDNVPSVTIPAGKAPATVDFYYDTIDKVADSKYVTLEIEGKAGDTELYRYTVREKRWTSNSQAGVDKEFYRAQPLDLDGYRLIHAEDAHSDGSIDLPLNGTKSSHTFQYENLATYVTIYMRDESGKEIAQSFKVNARAGDLFTYNAPHVSGYVLVSSTEELAEGSWSPQENATIGTVSPVLAEGKSAITFTYRKVQTALTVLAQEDNQDGRVIRVVEIAAGSDELEQLSDQQWSVKVPDLSADYYEPIADNLTAVSFTWDGQASLQVPAFYAKEWAEIDLYLREVDTETLLTDQPQSLAPARKGEAATFSAPDVTDYAIISPRTKNIVPTADKEDVTFYYEKIAAGQVVVKAVEALTGNLLQSYTLEGQGGSTIQVKAPQVLGYKLTGADAANSIKSVLVDGETGNEVVFLYAEDTVTLTVILEEIEGGKLSAPGFDLEIKVPRGSDYTVRAPHITGYVIQGESARTYMSLQVNDEITFTYKSAGDEDSENYLKLIIEGVTGQTVHYRYEKRIHRDDLPYTLLVGEDVFPVPGYKLAADQDLVVIESDTVKTFHYVSRETAVTIHMVDHEDADQAVAASFAVAATVGEAFSYNAPHVPDYMLADTEASLKTIAAVAEGGDSLTFAYKPIASDVVIVAKEENSDGRIILLREVENPQPGTNDYSVPDLTTDHYTYLGADNKISITYEAGQPVQVEAYYRKETVAVALMAVDEAALATLIATPDKQSGLRKGEAVVLEAPQAKTAEGEPYLLIGEATQSIIALDDSQVVFTYRALGAGEVLVNAVGSSNTLLRSYVERGEAGTERVIEPPVILGWQTSDSGQPVKFGQDKIVTFTFTPDVVKVTIKAEDMAGQPLGTPEAVEVARGSSYVARAPHVAGYIVQGAATQTFTTLTDDVTAVFTYKTLEEAVNENYIYVRIEGLTGDTVHYRYVKQIDREDLPYELVAGEDYFAVNGHKLAADQDLIINETDVRKTLRYVDLETFVTVNLVNADDTTQAVASSFEVSATAGEPFSYNAPYIPDYALRSAITQTLPMVADDGSSEVTFAYRPITGPVRLVLKEDGPAGDIIGLYEVPDPQRGTHSYEVPDLTDDYYTALAVDGKVSIAYDDVPVSVEVYYRKDTVTVELIAVDQSGQATLTAAPNQKTGVRKGETVVVEAPAAKNAADEAYVLVSNPTQSFTAMDGASATFTYRALAATEILVRAFDSDNQLLKSYVERGQVNENRNIKAPTILGWKADATALDVTFGQHQTADFAYTEDVVYVTIKVQNMQQQPIANVADELVKVARGGNYTARAPHVPGYVIDGEATKTFTALADHAVAVFTYKTLDEAADAQYLEIPVAGVTGGTTHYRFLKRIALTDLPYDLTEGVDIFPVAGYKMAADQDLTIREDDTEKTIHYVTQETEVTVRMVDADDSSVDVVPSFRVTATAGEPFSYRAPHVTDYALSSSSVVNLPTVAADGTSTVIFQYRKITEPVRLVMKEDDTNGPIIGLYEVPDPQRGTHSYDVPDLSDDYFTSLIPGGKVSITYEDVPVAVEVYYRKETVAIALTAVDEAGQETLTAVPNQVSGLRKGEMVMIAAPEAKNAAGISYLLVSKPTQTFEAQDGLTATFTYRALDATEVLVNAFDSDGGLLKSYVERGQVNEERTITAPVISGWKSTVPTQDVTFGQTGSIDFHYTEDVVYVTIKAQNLQEQPIASDEAVKVARGGNFTARAPHVPGYVVVEPATQVFTTLTDDDDAIFTYQTLEEAMDEKYLHVVVEGITGQSVHYRYVKQILRTDLPYDLVSGEDYFAVSGHKLAAGQDLAIYETDVRKTLNYVDLETTVTVHLVNADDTSQAVAPSFAVAATAGEPFSYLAPHVPDYALASSIIETLPVVADDGSSAVTFAYRPITGPVRLVMKEDDTNGAIVGLYEVPDPQHGTYEYAVPDLSGDYYTSLTAGGKVSITYTDVPVAVEVYYRKDTVTAVLKAADQAGVETLTAIPDQKAGLRKGEMVVVEAPQAKDAADQSYLLVSEPTQTLQALDDLTATFTYRALTATEVLVNAFDNKGNVLQSYLERGEVDETRTITAPKILGWKPSQASQEVTFGQTGTANFYYTEDVVYVTIKTQDSKGEPIAPDEIVKVARGGNYTARAPHVPGYVIDGAASQVFTNLADDDEALFTYKTLDEAVDEHYIEVVVAGVTGSMTHYQFVKRIAKTDLPYTLAEGVDIFPVNGYKMAAAQNLTIIETDTEKTIRYLSLETEVTVHMVNADDTSQAVAPSFGVTATAGEPFSYQAPYVPDYALSSSSVVNLPTVADDNSSYVTFAYRQITGPVRLVLKENDTNGPIIALYEVPNPQRGTHEYVVPDLTEDHYTSLTTGGKVAITYEDVPVSVEVYYRKETVSVDLVAVDQAGQETLTANPTRKTGLRKGAMAVIEAPEAKNAAGKPYLLVSDPTQILEAQDGLTATFTYRALDATEVLVNAFDSDGVLLRSYVERGAVNEERNITAPVISGWKATEPTKDVTFGQTSSIDFHYTEDVVYVTIKVQDLKEQPIAGAGDEIVKVARGADYTARAPHVPGYVIASAATQTFPALADNAEAVFTYKTLDEAADEHYLEVEVSGITGSTIHYQFVKRIPKTDLPYTLVEGVDIFPVVGYELADEQDLFITTTDREKTIHYVSLETTVTVHMVDADDTSQAVQPSYQVAAIAGESFLYYAPYIPDYALSSDITKEVEKVAADGSSSVTFEYRKILEPVRMILKEENTDGRIIGLYEVEEPQRGTHDYEVPDLRSDYYQTLAADGKVSITYEDVPVSVEVYYRKETINVQIVAVDQAGQEILTATPSQKTGLRKGETAVIEAPQAKTADGESYLLVSEPTQSFTALTDCTVTFTYRALDATEVLVSAISSEEELLKSYVERGEVNEERTVEAPKILGWKATGTEEEIKFGQTRSVIFDYVEDVVFVTIKAQDQQGQPLAAAEDVKVARGGAYTARAPHVGGYVIAGDSTKAFTDLQKNDEAVFTYRLLQEAADEDYLEVIIEGVTGDTSHYRYTKRIAKSELPYTLHEGEEVFTVPGYKLAVGQDLTVVETDTEKIFRYVTRETGVTIHLVDAENPLETVAPSFTISATAGEAFSCNAPHVPGFTLAQDEKSLKTIPAVAEDGDVLSFAYREIASDVVLVAKEENAEGRIILLREIADPQPGTNHYPVPDLTEDYYSYLGESSTIAITYEPGQPVQVELYYRKDTVAVTLKAVDVAGLQTLIADPAQATGLRKGEVANIAAPQAQTTAGEQYLLVSEPTQTLIALSDVEAVFAYRSLSAKEVLLNAVSDDGELLRSYVERGETGDERLVEPPVILGWQTEETAKSITFGQTRSLTFVYTEDVVTVTVKTEDLRGNSIASDETVTVKRGGDATVRAPHVAGYVVSGESVKTYTGLSLDTTATFTYKTLEEAMDEKYLYVIVEGLSGQSVHYRYVKQIAKTDLPYTLVDGEDIFAVPGHKMAVAQDLTIVATDTRKTIHYTTLETTVTIHMADVEQPGQAVAPSFVVAATADELFSYNAPHVADYVLSGAVTDSVVAAADGSSALTFYYKKLSGSVSLVLKEDNAAGRIIALYEVPEPQRGTHDYAVPDLSGDYYTSQATGGLVSITYEDVPVAVEVYYNKELADVTLHAVDQAAQQTLIAVPDQVRDLRKGEVASIEAPRAKTADDEYYLLVSKPVENITVLPGAEATFRYRALAADEILVSAVSEKGQRLRSYVERGEINEARTIHPPTIQGWQTADGAKPVTFGQTNSVTFVYTEDVVTVTIKAQDRQGRPLVADELVPVPRGGDYLARAPHVAGYVIDSEASQAFTTLIRDEQAVFTYRQAGDVSPGHYLTVIVEGRSTTADSADRPLYTTTKTVPKAMDEITGEILPKQTVSLNYNQEILNLRPAQRLRREDGQYGSWGITSDTADVYTLTAAGNDNEIKEVFYYDDNLYTVTVEMLLYGSESAQDVMPEIKIPGVEGGSRFDYRSPIIPGYQLVSRTGQNLDIAYDDYILEVGAADNTLTFYYVKASGNQMVTLKDGETNQPIGVEYLTLQANVPRTITPPDVPYYITTDAPQSVTWNGLGTPADIVFTYTRERQEVVLAAFALDGTPISDEDGPITFTMPQKQRVMEYYDYNNPDGGIAKLLAEVQARANASYTPVTPNSTNVLVDPAAAEIQVFFTLPADGAIPAEVWLDPGLTESAGDSERNLVYLYGYMVPAAAGETKELNEDQRPDLTALGYRLDAERSQLKAKEGLWKAGLVEDPLDPEAKDRFTMIMDDERLTIIAIVDTGDGPALTPTIYKVIAGNNIDVPVTYIPGYTLAAYQIAGQAREDDQSVAFVPFSKVEKDETITFYYKPITWGSSEYLTVSITERTEENEVLHTETRLVEKNRPIYTVTPQPWAGYQLRRALVDGVPTELAENGSLRLEPVIIVSDEVLVEFVYALDTTEYSDVTVRAVDEADGADLIDPQRYSVRPGSLFTCSAPDVADYSLLGVQQEDGTIESTTIGIVTQVAAEKGVSQITFVYQAIDYSRENEITVRAVETAPGSKHDQTSIRVQREQLQEEGEGIYSFLAPDLANDFFQFAAVDGAVIIESGVPRPVAEPDETPATETPDDDADSNEAASGGDGEEDSAPEDPAGEIPEIVEDDQSQVDEAVDRADDIADQADEMTDRDHEASADSLREETAAAAPQRGGLGLLPRVGVGSDRRATNRSTVTDLLTFADLEPGVYYDLTTQKVVFVGVEPAAEIVIYYTKELATIEVEARENSESGKALGESQFVKAVRKGEAATVTAPQITDYQIIGASKKSLIPENDLELVTFCYSKIAVQTGTLIVTVKNNNSVLAGATVTLTPAAVGEASSKTTGSDGTVQFDGVYDGTAYIVKAALRGYDTKLEAVLIEGEKTEFAISLSRSSTGGSGGGNNGGGNNGGGDNGGSSGPKDPDSSGNNPDAVDLLAPGAANELLALLRASDHLAYLTGYPDNTVRPDASITRAEAAQIFYQLMEPHLSKSFTIGGRQITPVSKSYRDVDAGQWYYTAVQTLSAYGILTGYPDGTFRPEDPITRAEFTVMVSQLAALSSGSHSFVDVVGHWAESYITNVSVRGFVSGYPDGTFRPENAITRAETVSLINRLLERQIHQQGAAPANTQAFTDLTAGHWAYEAIVEAANDH